jgi:PAS domain S-box-containing protein
MKDEAKTKKQLVEELAELRQRIIELEAAEVECRQAVKALAESEEKYRFLKDLSPHPVVILQGEGYKFINPAFTEVFGYTNDDVENGLSFLALVQEHEKKGVLKHYQDRLAGKQLPKTYKIDLVTKDGRLIPCETSSTVINYKGSPADLVIIRDISERIRAEEEVKKAHEQLEQRVQVRTRELQEANKQLEQEIQERRRAEGELKESEARFRMLVETMRDAFGVQDETGIINLRE